MVRMGGTRGQGGADQQRQKQGWLLGEGSDQGRFPDFMSTISSDYRSSKAQRPSAGNVNYKRGKRWINAFRPPNTE